MRNLSDKASQRIVLLKSKKGKSMENWRIYQDAHGEWRWWRLDMQGNIIQASELGFENKEQCENNAAIHGYMIKVLD